MPMNPMLSIRAITLVSAVVVAAIFPTRVCAQSERAVSAAHDPDVDVSIENPRNDKLSRIRFSATPGTYVVVIGVSSNGKVDVLYPAAPEIADAFRQSSETVTVPRVAGTSRTKSQRDIYAFASYVPFNFAKVSDGSGWNNLHLASYARGPGEQIARAFAAEISDPSSRVVVAPAIIESGVFATNTYRHATPWLAAFHSKPCPYLSRVTTVAGAPQCSAVGAAKAYVPNRRTPQQNASQVKKAGTN
jgi:hypothetical protein